jgi:hypothetical protein
MASLRHKRANRSFPFQVRHAVSLASGLGSAAEMRDYAAEGAAKWLELMRLEDGGDKTAQAAVTPTTGGTQARTRLVPAGITSSFLAKQ